MNPELTKAITQAGNIKAPNLGGFADIQKLYTPDFQAAAVGPAAQGSAHIAAQQAEAARAAAAHAAAVARQRADDMADLNKYRSVAKDDGGFDFYDPDGKQVDIATLAKRTGTRATDWIKNSHNPIDIQYRDDYKRMEKFGQAIMSKDKDKIDKIVNQAKAEGQDLSPYIKGKGGVEKLIQQFHQHYQRYYVSRDQDPNAWGYNPGGAFIPIGSSANQYGGPSGGGHGISY